MAFTINKTKTDNKNINNLIKLSAVINKIIYKDEESAFFVFSCAVDDELDIDVNNIKYKGNIFVAVGNSLMMSKMVNEGQEIDLWGRFEPGKQKNTIQFSVTHAQEKIPKNLENIELFISTGKLYGVGKVTAKKIVNKFKENTFDILNNNMEKLLEVEGINEKKLELMKQSWMDWKDMYKIIFKMRELNISESIAVKIYNTYKHDSLKVIQENPYSLIEIDSIGFKTIDKMAISLGMDLNNPQRIRECFNYILEELSKNGHTIYYKDEIVHNVAELLDINISRVEEILKLMIADNQIIEIDKKVDFEKNNITYGVNKKCLASKKIYNIETSISKEINRINDFYNPYETEDGVADIEKFIKNNTGNLDESQVLAARNVLLSKISVLTGGPGTGKTHTIKTLLNYFKNQKIVDLRDEQQHLIVKLAAPTGMAAKRIEKSTNEESSTIHRMLGYKNNSFYYGSEKRLEGDVFIIDESSMLDIWILNGLLKAIPTHAKVIFVGDADQLESVGAGCTFRDIIESKKIKVSKLKVPHRQSLGSNIIVSSHDIINKKIPKLYDIKSDSDFVFQEEDSDEKILNSTVNIVKNLIKENVNPNDIQILTPQKESLLGINKLNHELRVLLNKEYDNPLNNRLAKGDRIMQIKNNKDLDIYNGDVGIIRKVDKSNNIFVVSFDNKDLDIDEIDSNMLILSYAITIHKSQGSDYPYVIIPITKTHRYMWDINLLYTAITRGKKRVILVGDKEMFEKTILTKKQNNRLTYLKELIIEHNQYEEKNNLKSNNGITKGYLV